MGKLKELYDAAVKTMSKKGVFKQVYDILDDNHQYFEVDRISALEINKLLTEDGDFSRSHGLETGFGCSGPKRGGTKWSPHKINLAPPRDNQKKGFDQSTIFEEFFHAYQFVDNPDNENMLEIETEAKVAKVYQLYSQYGDNLEGLLSGAGKFGLGGYEVKLIIEVNENNVAIGLNKVVVNYFKALQSGSEITQEMETDFRKEVKELGVRVEGIYKDHFWNGETYENTGKTPSFDKLFKKQ